MFIFSEWNDFCGSSWKNFVVFSIVLMQKQIRRLKLLTMINCDAQLQGELRPLPTRASFITRSALTPNLRRHPEKHEVSLRKNKTSCSSAQTNVSLWETNTRRSLWVKLWKFKDQIELFGWFLISVSSLFLFTLNNSHLQKHSPCLSVSCRNFPKLQKHFKILFSICLTFRNI